VIVYDAIRPGAFLEAGSGRVSVVDHLTTAEVIARFRGLASAVIVEGRPDDPARLVELVSGLAPEVAVWTWVEPVSGACAVLPPNLDGYHHAWSISNPSDVYGSIVSRRITIHGYTRGAVFPPPRAVCGPLAGSRRTLVTPEAAETLSRLGHPVRERVGYEIERKLAPAIPFNPWSPAGLPRQPVILDVVWDDGGSAKRRVPALSRLNDGDYRILDVPDLLELLGFPRDTDLGSGPEEQWTKLYNLYPVPVATAVLRVIDEALGEAAVR
jgi:hypothetical protein